MTASNATRRCAGRAGRYRLLLTAVLAAPALHAAPAMAQVESTLIQPAIPEDYDRGRNVGVAERPRPDFDPLGYRQGGFLIFPRVDLGLGYTDNVFLSDEDRRSDAFALFAPSVRVQSDFSRHQVSLAAGGRFRRYFENSIRNKDEWYLNALGRGDIGTNLSVTVEGQAARSEEDPFSGQASATVAALSSYRRNFAALRGTYVAGRVRGILSVDHQDFTFSDIEGPEGARLSQRNRDRDIDRIAGQIEYALSPSIAAYGQLSLNEINYDVALAPNVANRDSSGFRAIAGASLDLSGLFRGIVGLGYTERRFDSPLYSDISGVSAEARVEYFPSELTTVTLNLRRAIEDSNIGVTSAFFDNRVGLRVDHELRRNIIVNASAEVARQDYVDSDERDNIWRARAGGRYLLGRTFGIQGDLGYARRHRLGGIDDFTIKEFSGLVSLVIQR